jgi:hypothetical protein
MAHGCRPFPDDDMRSVRKTCTFQPFYHTAIPLGFQHCRTSHPGFSAGIVAYRISHIVLKSRRDGSMVEMATRRGLAHGAQALFGAGLSPVRWQDVKLSSLSRSTRRPAQRTGAGRSPMTTCAPCARRARFNLSTILSSLWDFSIVAHRIRDLALALSHIAYRISY